MCTYGHTQTCARVLTAASFITSPNWKDPKSLVSLYLLSLTDESGMRSTKFLKSAIISNVTKVGTGGWKWKVRNVVKLNEPFPIGTKKTWGGQRGTPQKGQKQEPAGHQKGKYRDWGTSRKGTQKNGLLVHPWSSGISNHLSSSWPPPWSPCLQRWPSNPVLTPTMAFCGPSLPSREDPKFFSPAFKTLQHLLPHISSAPQCSSWTPGTPAFLQLQQHLHSSGFHTLARAVSATGTLYLPRLTVSLLLSLQNPVQTSSALQIFDLSKESMSHSFLWGPALHQSTLLMMF